MRDINKIYVEMQDLITKSDLEDELKVDVYHYTSHENMWNILKNRKLFMRNFSPIIDTEAVHTIDNLQKLMITRAKLLPRPIIYKDAKFTEFWESLKWYVRDMLTCYRMSFCMKRDDKYMYDIFGQGVAIRISKDYFKLSSPPLTLEGQKELILVRTKMLYEDANGKKGYLFKFAKLIEELLDHLIIENQDDIIIHLYSHIISWIPKFLTSVSNLHYENEYRIFAFYDHLSPVPAESLINVNNKEGIYTNQIEYKYIREIIIDSRYNNFSKEKAKIESYLRKEFPNNDFSHLKITQSKSLR